MKQINYKGSITEDLKVINSREFSPKKSLYRKYILLLGLQFLVLSLIRSKLGIGAAVAITTASFSNSYRNIAEDYEKKRKKASETENKLIEFAGKLGDSVYPQLVDPIIISNTVTEEEMDKYIEYITNDIYYLDDFAKIQVLRELRKRVTKKDKNAKYKETRLYMLESDDIASMEMPVKQVLRAKKD